MLNSLIRRIPRTRIRTFSSVSKSKEVFELDKEFIGYYDPSIRQPQFGFNGLGEIAYLRSYARFIEELGR